MQNRTRLPFQYRSVPWLDLRRWEDGGCGKKPLLKGNRGVETSGSFTKLRHEHVEGGIPVVREWDVRVGERGVKELS